MPWDPWWFAPDGVPLKGGPGHLVVWADTGTTELRWDVPDNVDLLAVSMTVLALLLLIPLTSINRRKSWETRPRPPPPHSRRPNPFRRHHRPRPLSPPVEPSPANQTPPPTPTPLQHKTQPRLTPTPDPPPLQTPTPLQHKPNQTRDTATTPNWPRDSTPRCSPTGSNNYSPRPRTTQRTITPFTKTATACDSIRLAATRVADSKDISWFYIVCR